MNILSVDIATRGYKDFGFAFLAGGDGAPQFPNAEDLGLKGKPEPESCAEALHDFCRKERVTALLLDGPQGWRYPKSEIEHMRLCERVLNTPGKTGNKGTAKPATYLGYTNFSIELFHHLRVRHGWDLLVKNWHKVRRARWVVEIFPTAAWKLQGLKPLPAKAGTKAKSASQWIKDLSLTTGLKLPQKLTHDEIQAAACLPVGSAITAKKKDGVILSGVDPLYDHDGMALEGYIANPYIRS